MTPYPHRVVIVPRRVDAALLLLALLRRGVQPEVWSDAGGGSYVPSLPIAIHEAVHALDLGLPEPWRRTTIGTALDSLRLRERVTREVLATAAGEIVTREIGDATDPLLWERVHSSLVQDRSAIPRETFRARVDATVRRPSTRALADRVLDLGGRCG